jgi:hypothetical protein
MYDTQYNRKIAKEIDRLNKEDIKQSQGLEGGRKGQGQKKYIKQGHLCHHCQGSGVSGSGVSGSGVSGSGVSGSGMFNIGVPGLGGLGVGWGKPESRKMKGKGGVGLNLPFGGFNVGWGKPEPEMEGKGGIGLNLPFGGFNVGWGKPEPKQMKGKGGIGLNLPFGGFNVGWGKKGEGKKRGNPNISKRAEIVKQVMKEQGLCMIEASQYIKKNNLY